jgi:hypothetical protein
MFLAVFSTFTVAYLAMGADRAFQPGSYEVSMLWVAISLALGFGAAVLGGWVAAAIARDARGPKVLAGFVLILGLLLALPAMTTRVEPGQRTAEVGNMAAMQQARTPPWVALLNPIIGALGVIVGGRRKLGVTP